MKGVNDFGALAELVRLPAVLTVPGDSLLGAASSGHRWPVARTTGLAASSCLLYLAGMALNDYADRDVDAGERPHRPIPSGRVEPRVALRIAQGLTVGGLVVAGLAGGRRALLVAVPLAGSVWAYDTLLKDTPAGPLAMATCRSLDVLLGAGAGSFRPAVAPAAIVGAHTLAVTGVSRYEARGGTALVGQAALAATAAVTAAAGAVTARRTERRGGAVLRVAAAVGLAAYAAPLARAAAHASRQPDPVRLQKLVGTGVLGLVPLEASMLAGSARPLTAAAVGGLWPAARRFSRKRSVT